MKKVLLWLMFTMLMVTNVHAADVAFTDGEGIDSVTAGGTTFTVSCEDATTANKGCASFASDEFTVSSGAVSITDGVIDDDMIDFGTSTNQVSASDLPDEDLGEMSISTGVWALDNYVIENVNMADDDFTDFSCTTGACTLDANTVADNEINYTAVTCADFTTSDCEAITAPTLDTGFGANELYDMNQHVLTTSDVSFNSVTAPLTGAVTGNASTATALAADPANCVSATEFAVGVTAAGVASCEAIADADVPDTITIDLAGTATALAADGTDCAVGSYARGVDASGNAELCVDATTEIDALIALHTADDNAHQDLVTLAGTPDYLTLSGQAITRTKLDISDDTNMTAGRSLTLTANDVVADSELYTGQAGRIAFETPTATDDFFFNEISVNQTATSIYCKTLVGTVDLDVQVGGADINGTDITCNTTGVLDSTLAGTTDLNVGDELSLAITSVASAPTYLMVIVNSTKDD